MPTQSDLTRSTAAKTETCPSSLDTLAEAEARSEALYQRWLELDEKSAG
jgi:hypothetical protein